VFYRSLLALTLALLVAFSASAQKKKKNKNGEEEEITQTLPLLKDPPPAILGDTAHLSFRVSTLSSKGLLSQQVRDGIKALLQDAHGATIIKLRAMVAGSGDIRRVQTIVSETFTEHKLSLPALSTIQVGALPMEGAQVVIESIALEKRAVNPAGLAFFAGQQAKEFHQSLDQLQTAVNAAGVKSSEILRATCFLSSLDDHAAIRASITQAFPSAAINIVQLQRLGLESISECEAVGRLETAPASAIVMLNPAGLANNPNYSQIALVNSPKLVFSGIQMAFGEKDADFRLAFGRLGRAIEPLGVTEKDVFWSSVYPLTKSIADKIRAVRFDYFDRARPPASTLLLFEGLPSLDASAAIDIIAAPM
jgi:enamine deaminase RidA (YjgF/YER057c/UK114 family)